METLSYLLLSVEMVEISTGNPSRTLLQEVYTLFQIISLLMLVKLVLMGSLLGNPIGQLRTTKQSLDLWMDLSTKATSIIFKLMVKVIWLELRHGSLHILARKIQSITLTISGRTDGTNCLVWTPNSSRSSPGTTMESLWVSRPSRTPTQSSTRWRIDRFRLVLPPSLLFFQHYINSPNNAHTDDGSSAWSYGVDHSAWQLVAKPYIAAYKAGGEWRESLLKL